MIKQRGKYAIDWLEVASFLFTKNSGLKVYNSTGGTLAAGTHVYINGFDATAGLPTVAKAVNTANPALLVIKDAIANNKSGEAYFEAEVTGLNTSGSSAVGALVYLSNTAGEFTFTAPTAAVQAVQVVGVVKAKAASGSIYFFPGRFALQKVIKSMIQVNSLDGAVVANVSDSNTIGGIPVMYRIPVPDGATGNVDVTVDHKIRVIDAWVVKTDGAGGAGDTIAVNNGATAISDAMSINVADKAVVRTAQIDDAQHEIAAAGTLRVVRTKASVANVACTVYVKAMRIA